MNLVLNFRLELGLLYGQVTVRVTCGLVQGQMSVKVVFAGERASGRTTGGQVPKIRSIDVVCYSRRSSEIAQRRRQVGRHSARAASELSLPVNFRSSLIASRAHLT